jgi:peptidyl-prolyl cis-trans isomerase C
MGLLACNDAALKSNPDGGVPVSGLTAEQASRVVAKIGDRTITLGDFAKSLEGMDPFRRLAYQSKERRRELLNEMVDIELLAIEARRRGLDKEPETQDAVRQILREAMLAKAREGLPAPAEISAEEVRAYYEKNRERFAEPQRRRVAAIIVDDPQEAEKVLELAKAAESPQQWGELFTKHSTSAPKTREATPVELAGDLGVVGPPKDMKGGNPRVPEAVREAAFAIPGVGKVADALVVADGKHYIVRLNGMTEPHQRTLAEADRSIRVLLIQEKMAAKERALEDELRKKFRVEIDEAALANVPVPPAAGQGAAAPARETRDAGP